MLIGLAGARRAGKDVVASHLVKNHGFVKYAMAAPLKELCQNLFRLTDDQADGSRKDVVDARYGMTPRRMFQIMGTDCIRVISPSYWVDTFQSWINTRGRGAKGVVVSDVRFQNEVDAIKARGGKVVLLIRGTKCCDACDRHVSEQVQDLKGVDTIIRNESSEAELCKKIDRFFGL